MDIKAQRLEILQQVENGEMVPDEAARWLIALEKVNGSTHSQEERLDPAPAVSQTLIQEAPVEPEQVSAGDCVPDKADSESQPEAIEPEPVPVFDPEKVDNQSQTEPVWSAAAYANTSQFTQSSSETPLFTKARPVPADELRLPEAFWRGWWLLAFIPGLLLVIAAVDSMSRSFLAAGLGWGFWLAFIPFGLGVVLLWLGWEIRMARWIYIHIQQKPGARPHEIRLSFPLPTGLLNWGMRRFGRFDARFHGQDVATLLQEIDQSVAADGPIHIFVDEGDGERVEVWIGGMEK
jgi:hypothetical protein